MTKKLLDCDKELLDCDKKFLDCDKKLLDCDKKWRRFTSAEAKITEKRDLRWELIIEKKVRSYTWFFS